MIQSEFNSANFTNNILFYFNLKAFSCGKYATAPNSSSIRSSWLYLAIRSEREAEPVFICLASNEHAKSNEDANTQHNLITGNQ